MTEYTWAFDKSFLVFLLIAFVSMALASKLRSMISMPLIYGTVFILGFALNILPKDMLLSANMIAVGTIAYHVLVVHSGIMIHFRLLKGHKKEVLLCIFSPMILILVVGIGLRPVLGRELSLLAPGAVVGGGASCAIASRIIMEKVPELSVFPWMIFMMQGLFCVPVVTWVVKKDSQMLLAGFRETIPAESTGAKSGIPEGAEKLCMRIPEKYKTAPYFLGTVMLVTYMNHLLQNTIFSNLHINGNITALILGMVLANVGLLERAPLFRSDSYGLLILGLMGLMANTLSNCPWYLIVSYLPKLLLIFAVSSVILVFCGI